MATTYRTREGDMLDAICYQHYGRESAIVDVMQANAGLADHGPILPSGLVIVLPALASKKTDKAATLWD